MNDIAPYSSFRGPTHLASGSLRQVAAAITALQTAYPAEGVLIFDNTTGRVLDLDFRGNVVDVLARLPAEPAPIGEPAEESARGPGRPRLGVVAKEITLLPRHWEWLASQPGGASVALRKLVEDARRALADKDRMRLAQERTYAFMSNILNHEAGFEDAARSLFAGKRAQFEQTSEAWPVDLRAHLMRLADGAFAPDFKGEST